MRKRVCGKSWVQLDYIVIPGEPVAYLEVTFFHKRPKRLCRKKDPEGTIPKETKPDLDNLIKLIKDGLNDCEYWADDKHNTTILADKMYVAKDGEPRTELYIYIQED